MAEYSTREEGAWTEPQDNPHQREGAALGSEYNDGDAAQLPDAVTHVEGM